MLFYTHLLFGISFFLIFRNFFGGNEIIFFLLVLFGSIFPDIDERKSKINRWSGIVGTFVNTLAKHRGIFHSLIFSLFLFMLMFYFWSYNYAMALLIGYSSHLIADGLTPMGIQVFYPFSKFKIRGFIRTGGIGEYLVLVLLALVILKILF